MHLYSLWGRHVNEDGRRSNESEATSATLRITHNGAYGSGAYVTADLRLALAYTRDTHKVALTEVDSAPRVVLICLAAGGGAKLIMSVSARLKRNRSRRRNLHSQSRATGTRDWQADR